MSRVVVVVCVGRLDWAGGCFGVWKSSLLVEGRRGCMGGRTEGRGRALHGGGGWGWGWGGRNRRVGSVGSDVGSGGRGVLVVSELGCKKGRGIIEAGAYNVEWIEEGVRREDSK